MILSAIVAMDRHNAIGKNNQLPWHLPEDLKFFKRTTLGKHVLMGRKTYDSLGKPLKNRLNIVLSTKTDLQLPQEVLVYNSLTTALGKLESENTEEAFVIGGGKVFEETIQDMDRLYITHVDTVVDGAEVFFPHVDHSQWKLTWEEKHIADEKHAFDYTFCLYERIEL
jgi:dihydrofolate reductase